MSLSDTQILSVVQIALIGILVVIGMFLMWRKIQRLEQKMEMFMASYESGQCFMPQTCDKEKRNFPSVQMEDPLASMNEVEDLDNIDDDEGEEALINQLFQEGGNMEDATAAFMVFTPYGFNGGATATNISTSTSPVVASATNVKIEEVPESQPEAQSQPVEKMVQPEADTMSEAPTEKGGLTRTKIIRMNVDRLKEVLAQYGLSTEGTRKQLGDRLIEKLQL